MDVSSWLITSYGENSTLEKLELLSPEGIPYVIKFPRSFDDSRTNWEDLNEIIASKIAEMLKLKAVDAEVAYYNGRRACLMRHFAPPDEVDDRETVATLLSADFEDQYESLSSSTLPNLDRLNAFTSIFKQFRYYDLSKEYYVNMNLFDILIGNQDRHGHNWQLLFFNDQVTPSPLYDNGASLGWQLPEERIQGILSSPEKMQKLFTRAHFKVGLDNREIPKIKTSAVIEYLIRDHPVETKGFLDKLKAFDMDEFQSYCLELPFISETRKKFLISFIEYRRTVLIHKLEGGM